MMHQNGSRDTSAAPLRERPRNRRGACFTGLWAAGLRWVWCAVAFSAVLLAGCSTGKPGAAPAAQSTGANRAVQNVAPTRSGSAFRPGPLWLLPPTEAQSGVGDYFAITANRTPFYSFGPAQTQGPDQLLGKGDTVQMVKRAFGFSKVRTESGLEGYVATDRLAPSASPPPPEPMVVRRSEKLPPAAPLKVLPFDQMFETVEPPLPSGVSPAE